VTDTIREARAYVAANPNAPWADGVRHATERFADEVDRAAFLREVFARRSESRAFADDCDRLWPESKRY
jgi:hypothetical protein